jgi:hypothetical protein
MNNANNNLANSVFFPDAAFQNPQHLLTVPQIAVHGAWNDELLSFYLGLVAETVYRRSQHDVSLCASK